jgi:hypothetical protein
MMMKMPQSCLQPCRMVEQAAAAVVACTSAHKQMHGRGCDLLTVLLCWMSQCSERWLLVEWRVVYLVFCVLASGQLAAVCVQQAQLFLLLVEAVHQVHGS